MTPKALIKNKKTDRAERPNAQLERDCLYLCFRLGLRDLCVIGGLNCLFWDPWPVGCLGIETHLAM